MITQNNAFKAATDINEDEQIFRAGDDIASSFFYGNYTQGIKDMLEYKVSASELEDYLMELSDEYDCNVSDLYSGHFTASYMASIGESYQQAIYGGRE